MGTLCDQLVIGRGASALSFLYYAREAENKALMADNALTYVIGRKDLWGKISGANSDDNNPHPFGQPAQLVHMPGNTAPTVQHPSFQNASEISDQLRAFETKLSNAGIRFRDGVVTRVTRAGGRFEVTTDGADSYNPKQLIVASGFGPSAMPPGDVLKGLSMSDYAEQVMGGTEYLYSKVKVPTQVTDFTVAVMGTSATSSWAVRRACALGAKRIVWISRGSFADANPAGRNTEVLNLANSQGWLMTATVKQVKAAENGRLSLVLAPLGKKDDASTGPLSSLGQSYKQFYEDNKVKNGDQATGSFASRRYEGLELKSQTITAEEEIIVDHFVYALGADTSLKGGVKDILGPLCEELEPVFDTERRYGDVPADTTVAFRTAKGDIWVVGAAVFRLTRLKSFKNESDWASRFSNVSKMMCEGGSPPEGIAAIFASMKGVTGFVAPPEKVNLQLADFKEIEKWIAALYLSNVRQPISDRTRRAMADQIVAMRKHSVFGLTPLEVSNLTDLTNEASIAFWSSMLAPGNPGRTVLDDMAAFAT